jgi:hypothetical protein
MHILMIYLTVFLPLVATAPVQDRPEEGFAARVVSVEQGENTVTCWQVTIDGLRQEWCEQRDGNVDIQFETENEPACGTGATYQVTVVPEHHQHLPWTQDEQPFTDGYSVGKTVYLAVSTLGWQVKASVIGVTWQCDGQSVSLPVDPFRFKFERIR